MDNAMRGGWEDDQAVCGQHEHVQIVVSRAVSIEAVDEGAQHEVSCAVAPATLEREVKSHHSARAPRRYVRHPICSQTRSTEVMGARKQGNVAQIVVT
jgi:hypothetical protein